MSNENGFIQLSRDKETMELVKEQDAFTLLSIIALRARRTLGFNVKGLKQREALIGDYKNYGMTEQRYRTSKSKLEKWGFATFKATNKGTIATLCNERIYDINLEPTNGQTNKPVTSKQRTGNERVTTNNNVNNENNDNNDNIYTLQDVKDKGLLLGWADELCENYFIRRDRVGWVDATGRSIKKLQSDMLYMKNNGYLNGTPPKEDKDEFMRKVMQDVANRDSRENKGIMASVDSGPDIPASEGLF